MKALRLAIVCRYVRGVSGTVTTILEHSKRLSRLGWKVDVYGEKLDTAAISAAGATPRWIPGWPWGSYLKRRWFSALADRAVDGVYDLVHGHGDHFRQDALSLHNCVHAAHEAIHGAPLPSDSGVGRMHGGQLRERRFRVLIANSQLTRDEVVKRFGVPSESIRVIYPGHDPVRFNPRDRGRFRRDLRPRLGFLETDVVFGLITSGDFVKRGVEVFIEALGLAAPRAKGRLRALIMGKDKHLSPYRRLVAAEGLGNVVTFLPPSTEVERFYHSLDVYVHPAHYEEFGQSVQEALACGLPVLTNRRVGAAELMSGEAREYLLERSQREPLAGQIGVLAGDAGLRQRLSELGPACVAANDWDANFAATFAVYQRILAEAKKG